MAGWFKKRVELYLEESSFIREYLWKYRRWVGLGLLTLVIVDILEVLPPLFLKGAVDVATEGRPMGYLAYFSAAYFGTSVIQAFCRYGWRMYLIRTGMYAGRDLRNRLVDHLFGLSASFFDRTRIGNVMALATSDIDAIRMQIGTGILIIADAIFYFTAVPVAMYLLSPKLTLIVFLPLPFVPWIVARNEREIHARYEAVQKALAELSSTVQESLSGVRVVKAFAKEKSFLARFRDQGREYSRLAMSLARVNSAFGPTLDFAVSVGMVTLLWVGGRDLIGETGSAAGAVTLGTFVAFQRYVQKMVWPMAAIGMAISMYQRAVTSSGRLKDVLRETTDVPDAVEPKIRAPMGAWKTPGAIEFKNLRFTYPGAGAPALTEISLKVEAGERIAFVGAIGSGKTALLSLLPRLYPVGRGMLLIDGVDINDWPIEELRRQVGYVSQDVFLFSESVTENIAFGLSHWAALETESEAILAATALAKVHDEVLSLEGSYKTRLGERGVNLSGGQKQRLTIARALVKQPSILVLDDALSAVDVKTEESILEGLRNRPGRNTEIVAAHRISTVKDADRLVVIAGGQIRQQGSYSELLADRRGAFRQIYEEQRRRADLENYMDKL